jgi:hypothetical protein
VKLSPGEFILHTRAGFGSVMASLSGTHLQMR